PHRQPVDDSFQPAVPLRARLLVLHAVSGPRLIVQCPHWHGHHDVRPHERPRIRLGTPLLASGHCLSSRAWIDGAPRRQADTPAMTSVWRSLAFVFRETDARYGRLGRKRCRRAMSPPEVAAIRRVLAMLPVAVETWSEGNARLEPFETRVLETALASLSDARGGRYWPAPADPSAVIAD